MNPLTRSDHLFGPLFSSSETEALWSSEAFLAHFAAFETALARAGAASGLVTAEQASLASEDIASFRPDLAAIGASIPRDGLPVPEYVRQLKSHARPEALPAIHLGGTSQDLIDTAQSLILRDANGMLDLRLSEVIAGIRAVEEKWGRAPLQGRTRMQSALPILVKDRVETWYLPLAESQLALVELRPKIEALQFGGAVGDRSAVAPHGAAIASFMAQELGLSDPGRSWQTMRRSVADYAGWLSLVTGSLGKLGQDLVLMAQQGIDEVAFVGGGSSSAMPHKQNPVLAETLLALARFNAAQLPLMHAAIVHEQERSGTAWTTEWMALPAMLSTTMTSLKHASTLLKSISRLGNA